MSYSLPFTKAKPLFLPKWAGCDLGVAELCDLRAQTKFSLGHVCELVCRSENVLLFLTLTTNISYFSSD